MKIIENQTFDEERALYGSSQLLVRNCAFDGPADGESAKNNGITKTEISEILTHAAFYVGWSKAWAELSRPAFHGTGRRL